MIEFQYHRPITVVTKPEENVYDVLQPYMKTSQWTIGGLWSSFLLKFNGNRTSCSLINDVDFNSMYCEGVAKGHEEWATFKKVIKKGAFWLSWEECKNRLNEFDVFPFYDNQEVVQRLKKAFNTHDLSFIDQFHNAFEDDYCHLRGNDSFVTSALLYDDEWVSHGNLDKSDWQKIYLKTFTQIPKECNMTIVDERIL